MIVLTCKLFVFDGVLFLQLFGVAMGTRVAPTFACLFMGWLEVKMLSDWRGLAPYLWRRFIDDIFFLWRGSEEELLEFVEFLNNFHPTIKFKCKSGVNYDFTTKSVDFLDTTIWIDSHGLIQTTLYTKPSRVVQYLLPSSSHPSHITKNIPYSLGYRLRRIESTEERFMANLERLQEELLQRGYEKSIMKEAFRRVKLLDRHTTLQKVVKPAEDRVTLTIPFDKRLPNISSILHHRWRCLVDKDPTAKNYMAKPPRVTYSKTLSLREMIVRAKVPPQTARSARRLVNTGFKKCGKRSDCSMCSHSVNSNTHTCNHTGETFPISSCVSCTTPGVIYCITCTKDSGQCAQLCGPQYIGCTERMVKTRFSEHVGSATQPSQENTTKPVGVHFRAVGHTHCNMRILPIEKVRSSDRFVLEARESYWINKYSSMKTLTVNTVEHGMNMKG